MQVLNSLSNACCNVWADKLITIIFHLIAFYLFSALSLGKKIKTPNIYLKVQVLDLAVAKVKWS